MSQDSGYPWSGIPPAPSLAEVAQVHAEVTRSPLAARPALLALAAEGLAGRYPDPWLDGAAEAVLTYADCLLKDLPMPDFPA